MRARADSIIFAWRAARTAPPCLRATANVFDALGTSGVSEELLLDRHWRNARILVSHNPRVYKARILGDWLIHGKDPLPNIAKLGRGGQGN